MWHLKNWLPNAYLMNFGVSNSSVVWFLYWYESQFEEIQISKAKSLKQSRDKLLHHLHSHFCSGHPNAYVNKIHSINCHTAYSINFRTPQGCLLKRLWLFMKCILQTSSSHKLPVANASCLIFATRHPICSGKFHFFFSVSKWGSFPPFQSLTTDK